MANFFSQKNILVSLFTLLFFGLFGLVLFFFVQNTLPWIESPHVQMVRTAESQEIIVNSDQSIGQSFIASSQNLGKIGLLIHRGQNPLSRYVFHLKHSPEDLEDLLNIPFEVRKIQETAYFQFEPIEDSLGKSFYFYLEPDYATSVPLGLFTAVNNLEDGSLHINHSASNQDLLFQVYYKKKDLGFWSFCQVLFARMSQYKPDFLKVPFLYAYWILFFIGFIVTIFYLLHKFFQEIEDLSLKWKIFFLLFFWGSICVIFLWIQTQAPLFTAPLS